MTWSLPPFPPELDQTFHIFTEYFDKYIMPAMQTFMPTARILWHFIQQFPAQASAIAGGLTVIVMWRSNRKHLRLDRRALDKTRKEGRRQRAIIREQIDRAAIDSENARTIAEQTFRESVKSRLSQHAVNLAVVPLDQSKKL
jgi:hypothetical protein